RKCMKGRMIQFLLVLLVLILLGGCAAKTVRPIFDIAKDGTPQEMKAAIDRAKGANVNDLEYGAIQTVLMWAAEFNKDPDVITTLLKAGADIKEPDKNGFTPLMIAAENNTNPEVITRLVSLGADLEAKDQNGFTALMEAASKNHSPDVIIALLKAGANAKAKNNKGFTALDYAKANRSLDGTNALKQ